MRRADPPANAPENRDLLAGGGPAGDDTGDERTCFSPVGNTGIVLRLFISRSVVGSGWLWRITRDCCHSGFHVITPAWHNAVHGGVSVEYK